MTDIYTAIKLHSLKKERQAIRDNRTAWINKHKHSMIDDEIARTFKAYEGAINRINNAIRTLRD